MDTIDDPSQAADIVDSRLAAGADFIKIVYSGGNISREILAAVIDEAHRRNTKAVIHIENFADATVAIESGADGLVHMGSGPANETYATVAANNGAFVITTLTVMESGCQIPTGVGLANDPDISPFLSPKSDCHLRRFYPPHPRVAPLCVYGDTDQKDHVLALMRAGVPILAGTDAPNAGVGPASIHRELELLVDQGMTPTEALAAATSVPATHMDLPDRGRIAVGKRADLLLVDGDPTTRIADTRTIVAVYNAGQRVDRVAFRARVEQDRQRVADRPELDAARSGHISDFDNGRLTSAFGQGWIAIDDRSIGGTSTAQVALSKPGAEGSARSLRISGVFEPLAYPTAGTMFVPGKDPTEIVKVPAKSAFTFWARGEAPMPLIITFASEALADLPNFDIQMLTETWKQYVVPVNACELDGLKGISFSATAPGEFAFELDQIRFENR